MPIRLLCVRTLTAVGLLAALGLAQPGFAKDRGDKKKDKEKASPSASSGCQSCNTCNTCNYCDPCDVYIGGMGAQAGLTVDRSLLTPLHEMEARLVLNVPADAAVYFGRQRMVTSGTVRTYVIPVSQAGTGFKYPVKVVIPGDADILVKEFTTELVGGKEKEVSVTAPPGANEIVVEEAPPAPELAAPAAL